MILSFLFDSRYCYNQKKKMKYNCPECKREMDLLETWDSLLKMATWYKYGCEYCGGLFEIKK